MEKKKYNLGVMDLYPLVCNKTKIENNPYFQVTLKENVEAQRLYKAVSKTLGSFPLFGCTIKYKKGYFLETNEKDFIIFNKSPEKRPLVFGDKTNGYPWQLCYDEKTICFEWCHGVTDGRGGMDFFLAVICNYFGVETKSEKAFELGLESIFDEKEDGIAQKKQPSGFGSAALPYIKRGYKTDCHILRVPMKQVLSVSKKNDASPASVLPPLFSMAIRKNLSPREKNRNVSCNMPIDCRGIMKKSSMHNFIVAKVITYIDKYDNLDFALVSTIYRAILDLATQPENIIKEATEKVKLLEIITKIKPKPVLKLVSRIITGAIKHSESNFTFTYLGRLLLPQPVMDSIEDFHFRSWHDFGECNIAAIDVGGTLVVDICENYKNKQVIPDFIEIAKSVGIDFEETDTFEFEQAGLRMKSI